jgi:hypothetical protein
MHHGVVEKPETRFLYVSLINVLNLHHVIQSMLLQKFKLMILILKPQPKPEEQLF